MDSESPQGYHRLAGLMGHYPEAAIFRRFGSLNMLTLLSLQAELIDLQAQFRDMCAEDNSSYDPIEKQFSTYFRLLRGAEDSIQYEKLLEIRRKLQEYSKFRYLIVSRMISILCRHCSIAGSTDAEPTFTGGKQSWISTWLAERK